MSKAPDDKAAEEVAAKAKADAEAADRAKAEAEAKANEPLKSPAVVVNEPLEAARREAKESGVLILHRSGVWTWPGCPTDPTSTHLHLPLDSIPDAKVKEGIADGELHVTMVDAAGAPTAVRVRKGDEPAPRVISSIVAGTVEAATESV